MSADELRASTTLAAMTYLSLVLQRDDVRDPRDLGVRAHVLLDAALVEMLTRAASSE